MDHPHDEPRSGRPERTVVYVDASGALVDDPAKAAAGEIIESDRLGRMRSRAWFRIEEVELRWLPVRERDLVEPQRDTVVADLAQLIGVIHFR